MSTMFSSIDEAKDYARVMLGLGPEIQMEEIETIPVGTFGSDLLIEKAEQPNATENDKQIAQSIKETMAGQKTFKFMKDGEEYQFPLRGGGTGTVQITIGPFRDGFDCWMLMPNGFTRRI